MGHLTRALAILANLDPSKCGSSQGGYELNEERGDNSPGSPASPSWGELSRQRWGPSLDHDLPPIVIDRPDRDRMLAALETAEVGDDAFHPDRCEQPPEDVVAFRDALWFLCESG